MNQNTVFFTMILKALIKRTNNDVKDIFIAYITDYDELDDIILRNIEDIEKGVGCKLIKGLRNNDKVLLKHNITHNEEMCEFEICNI